MQIVRMLYLRIIQNFDLELIYLCCTRFDCVNIGTKVSKVMILQLSSINAGDPPPPFAISLKSI